MVAHAFVPDRRPTRVPSVQTVEVSLMGGAPSTLRDGAVKPLSGHCQQEKGQVGTRFVRKRNGASCGNAHRRRRG
nr:MAG TPA: hypothetical protein [Caudoviricetes sp.]